MPIYDYSCALCHEDFERFVLVSERDNQICERCHCKLFRWPSVPAVKIAGAVVEGGGPDRFTADALGIPLKDLPPELKS